MATATIEERVASLEMDIANIKVRQNNSLAGREGVIGRTSPDFLDQCFGIFAGSKMAEEVFREILEEREREREAARNAPDEEDE